MNRLHQELESHLVHRGPSCTDERKLSPARKDVLNFVCTGLANCFLAGGVYALLSLRLGLPTPLAMGVVVLLAFGLQFWVGRSYARARDRDGSEAAELTFVIRALIGGVILQKLVYLGLPDLVPEEAYYWQYAQHLSLSYLDHPAMVAWGIWGGTAIFGDTEFGVRVFTLLCGWVAAGFMAGLARDLFGKKAAAPAFLLTCLLPYPFVFGFFATPDAPLLASWAGALFYLQRALFGERRWAWIGFGICMGFGMLSKYSMVLLAPATFAFLVLDKNSRRWFLRPEPYLAILFALVIFLPVLIWNYQNDWESFAYQGARRMKEPPEFMFHKVVMYSFLLITPWGVLGAISAFSRFSDWRSLPDGDAALASRRQLWVFLAWLLPFAVFAYSSLSHRTKMSWTGPVWLTLIPVLAFQWIYRPESTLAGVRWLRAGQWRGVLVFLIILYAGMFHYMTLGLPGIPYRQRGVKPVAWEEFGSQVQGIVDDMEAKDRSAGGNREVYVVATDRFQTASELAFYRRAGERVRYTTRPQSFYGGNGVMYETWFPDRPPSDILMLFVSFKRHEIEDFRIQIHSLELGEVQRVLVMKGGKSAGVFYYRVGRGYLTGFDSETAQK